MEHQNYAELTADIRKQLGSLREEIPYVMKGFNEMSTGAIADGVLPAKTKELIALALGVAARCDGCLGFHTQALVKLGATRAEVAEALGTAVYMGGGPSLMYAANAIKAFDEASE
jgi:AhpD family alkylhydroperoxidase